MKKIFLVALSLLCMISAPHARDLDIGVGNFPPYFDSKGSSGLFNELIRETFKLLPDYTPILIPEMSNRRLVVSLNSGAVDGAANIFSDAKIVGCRSDPIFRFTDVAVTRKDRHFNISSVEELKGKSIVTYQGARTFLGNKFDGVIDNRPERYQEVPQPMDQARMLDQGMVDVSVGDLYIFLNAVKTWPNARVTSEDFTIHRLFPDIYSHMAFRDQKLCDDFNLALKKLKKLKKSGKYEEIYTRYLKNLK